MKATPFYILLLATVLNASPIADSSRVNDYEIAKVLRSAVRAADESLLQMNDMKEWREYLKMAAVELRAELQPLVLIKFDEDVRFRNQLKSLVEWERNWQKKETEFFIYYYNWDEPVHELVLGIQDLQFRELTNKFAITLDEKVPYRYDGQLQSRKVYPMVELLGGVETSQPFDLEMTARVIFSFVNPEIKALIEPLSQIYGSYFQNKATAEAYYEKSLSEIKTHGYVPLSQFLSTATFETRATPAWFSAYAFTYDLVHNWPTPKVTEFLGQLETGMNASVVANLFQDVFGQKLGEFESRYNPVENREPASIN